MAQTIETNNSLGRTEVYVHCFPISERRLTRLLQTFRALIHCVQFPSRPVALCLDVFLNHSCLYYSVSLPLYINTKAWFPTLRPSVAQWLKKTGLDEPRPHHRSVSANHVTLCKLLNLFELVSSSVNMMQVPLPQGYSKV